LLVIYYVLQSLGPRGCSFRSLRGSVGVQSAMRHTTIELTGHDRPGLLSEIFAVLSNLKCNIVSAEIWTHNSRIASIVYITDHETGLPIEAPEQLSKIKQLLLFILKGDQDRREAQTAVSRGSTHTQRRLHQLMYADRDYDYDYDTKEYEQSEKNFKQFVTVENCSEKGYTVINLKCPDRPKLLFDTVCTLTDMQYVVYHATIIAEGIEASQVILLLNHIINSSKNPNYSSILFSGILHPYDQSDLKTLTIHLICFQEFYIRMINRI